MVIRLEQVTGCWARIKKFFRKILSEFGITEASLKINGAVIREQLGRLLKYEWVEC